MRFALSLIQNEIRNRREVSELVGMSPNEFATKVLRIDLWEKQIEISEAIARGDRDVYVKTGHGVGKTNLAAVITAWALVCLRPAPIVITTAPTWRQVEDLLWREIKVWWNKSRILTKLATPTRACILELSPKNYAKGISTNEPERFQGWHNERLLFIIDEANGFPSDIWQSIESCMTNVNAQLFAIGNAVLPYGKFYDAFAGRTAGPTLFSISSREHPNVIAGEEIIPGAVTREWIKDFEGKYPKDICDSRIDAIFPSGSPNGIISQLWIDRAYMAIPKTTWPCVLSVDVARYGNNATALTLMQGQVINPTELYYKLGTTETARLTIEKARNANVDAIVIDDDGVGGGVTDIVEETGLKVVRFRNGMPAQDSGKFFNSASEAWWNTREMFERNGVVLIAHDRELEFQLTTREYKLQSDKRIRIESKNEYTSRTGMPSPDTADSVVMACNTVLSIWAESREESPIK